MSTLSSMPCKLSSDLTACLCPVPSTSSVRLRVQHSRLDSAFMANDPEILLVGISTMQNFSRSHAKCCSKLEATLGICKTGHEQGEGCSQSRFASRLHNMVWTAPDPVARRAKRCEHSLRPAMTPDISVATSSHGSEQVHSPMAKDVVEKCSQCGDSPRYSGGWFALNLA